LPLIDAHIHLGSQDMADREDQRQGLALVQTAVLSLALLASTMTTFAAATTKDATPMPPTQPATPLHLTAPNLTIATGQPSLALMSSGSTHLPVWSLSGGTAGQSVAGLVGGLPGWCGAVKVEIVVTTTDAATSPELADVYRCHLSQMVDGAPFTAEYVLGTPVRTALPAGPFHTRTILLDPYYEVDPNAPLWVRIQREPDDPADTFGKPTGLAMVKVTPLAALAQPRVVQDVSGYNSWPMIQAIGGKLVCVYSRARAQIVEMTSAVPRTPPTARDVSPETVVARHRATACRGRKGLDATGRCSLGARSQDCTTTSTAPRTGRVHVWRRALAVQRCRSRRLAAPVSAHGAVVRATIRTTRAIPGTLTSRDDGATWTQTVIESGLTKDDWPTEPAAVYLGGGRILCVARTEAGGVTTTRAQFQMVSTDSGATWTRARTNIGDVTWSTPSLLLDAETGLLSNYYYQRGKGVLWRRVVDPDIVFDQPLAWPGPEPVATGSRVTFDAGNVNATAIGGTHFLAFYSGEAPDTAVLVAVASRPVRSRE